MIDEDRTMQLYGYTSDQLPLGSHKYVVAVCEECGRYHRPEMRRLQELCSSCSQIGEGNNFFGKKHTLKTRLIIGETSKGRHHTDETKIRLSRPGKNHWNWQGGITPWRNTLSRTAVYKNWRKAVFERDDYTCQICNERGGYLESHHILPVRDNKNTLLIVDVNNGITLCKKCHNKTKGKEYVFAEQFEAIIRGKQT